MTFWIAAAVTAAVVALYIARPLALSRRGSQSRAAHDAQVFRDQLAEIDRDLERGVLDPREAGAARIEVSRRLLAADAESRGAADHAPAPKLASYGLALSLLVAAPLGGWALYEAIGAPGLLDQPFAARDDRRPSQVVAEGRIEAAELAALPPELAERVESLRASVETDPDNRRALFDLAQLHTQTGRFREAWRAWDALLEADPGQAPAAIYAALGEAMVLATRGYVSPEAEETMREALRRDPEHPIARYYLGAAQEQTGAPEEAMRTWAELIEDSPPDAPWLASARAQIDDVAARTGLTAPRIRTAPPASPDEARGAMIETIDQFERRIRENGGSAGEWAQLVRSWRTLGLTDRAEAAEAAARAALEGDALAELDALLARPVHSAEGAEAAVEALDARLRAEGGAPEEWLRLVVSLSGLGRADDAATAADRARETLSSDPDGLRAFEAGMQGMTGGAPAAALRGPSAGDVAAASEMSADDRAAMIEGMVSGLRERLYADGGDEAQWARLIRAYGVLGDADAAADAYARAMRAHGGDAASAERLGDIAALAGVEVE